MIDYEQFKEWLKENTTYTDNVITDIISRIKRANSILSYDSSETYLYYMEQQEAFKNLSVSVRSQIRKAIRLYGQYEKSSLDKEGDTMTNIEKFIVSMPREKVPESRLAALLAMEYPVVTVDGDKVNFAYDYTPGMDGTETAAKVIMLCKEQ